MDIKVRIVQLGKGVFLYRTDEIATVESGLSVAGINAVGMDVRVNSRPADPSQPLRDGDLVTVIPLIKGGGKHRAGRLARWRRESRTLMEDMPMDG